jgi:hypothetical protein
LYKGQGVRERKFDALDKMKILYRTIHRILVRLVGALDKRIERR